MKINLVKSNLITGASTIFIGFGLCLFVWLSVTSPVAYGESTPQGTVYDARIKYVFYNPDDVVEIKTRAGNSTLIQLERGEVINGVKEGGLSFGDKEAWAVGVRENNIFIKPKGPFPDTNINIVTNLRTYSISLTDEKDIKKTAWQVRYMYPPKPVVPVPEKIVHPDLGPCSDGPKNLNWFKYGDQVLSPSEVWDDGRFTCFRFPTARAMPVIYRYTPNSDLKEALVNFNVKGDVVIVHEVSKEFRLRLGKQVLGVKTDSLHDAPFNERNTTTGETRVRVDGQ